MSRTCRLFLASTLAVALSGVIAAPASASFDAATLKCRAAVTKAGTKLARATLKVLVNCHKARDSDASLGATECNAIATGDLQTLVPAAETRFTEALTGHCTGVTPAAALYGACPSPCDADVPTISTFADVAACQVCLERRRVETFASIAFGDPNVPVGGLAACHMSILKNGINVFGSILKLVAKCQYLAERTGATTTDGCADTGFDALVGAAATRAHDAIEAGSCAGVALPQANLDACGNAGDSDELGSCVAAAAHDKGKVLATELLELEEPPATTTTTTTLPISDSACPGTADLVLYARDSRIECSSNAECDAPRICDAALGHCTTPGDFDFGWTGLGHHADSNDETTLPAILYCPGPAAPACGQCNVEGIDPARGNCRCANDPRQICDQPLAAHDTADCPACLGGPTNGGVCSDNSDCSAGTCARRCSNEPSIVCSANGDCPGGFCRTLADQRCSDGHVCSVDVDCVGTCTTGAACDCYIGAPTPLSAGGTPSCIVYRLAENLSGTLDVDLGSMEISTKLREKLSLGISTTSPCPTCGGTCSNDGSILCDRDLDCGGGTCNLDPVAGDGLRGGVCVGGQNAGQSCDVQARNSSFPAFAEGPSGSGYSLDCMPDVGKNVSGLGLQIAATQSTGSTPLAANLSCGGTSPELNCPCLECSTDTSVPCSSNAECASQSGACAAAHSVLCSTNGDCSSVDGGKCSAFSHRCQLAPSVACSANADCDHINAGACTPSTCSATGPGAAGVDPYPNQCDGLACTDDGGGEGHCTDGPDLQFCDGLLKANGAGILACSANDDCSVPSVGIDAGNCVANERERCFVDPIVASGSADPQFPVVAAAYCTPPTSNAGINVLAGLPGPTRSRTQSRLTSYCAGSPLTAYTPGSGGCP